MSVQFPAQILHSPGRMGFHSPPPCVVVGQAFDVLFGSAALVASSVIEGITGVDSQKLPHLQPELGRSQLSPTLVLATG